VLWQRCASWQIRLMPGSWRLYDSPNLVLDEPTNRIETIPRDEGGSFEVGNQVLISSHRKLLSSKATVVNVAGNLDVWRDWGWAEEYVEAMHLILRHDSPEDFVIATGQSDPLRTFVAEAFAAFNLDWRAHVISSAEFVRPSDISVSAGSPIGRPGFSDGKRKCETPKLCGGSQARQRPLHLHQAPSFPLLADAKARSCL
jgi:hypothetical protein